MSAKIIMSYTNSPMIHKAVVIINELQFNEIKTMADERGMKKTMTQVISMYIHYALPHIFNIIHN